MEFFALPNGIKIVYYPIENAQSVEIGLYIKVGSRNETKKNNGITHLLEHLHFQQLGNMTQEEIYQKAECMGSSLRATTYKEMLHFHMKIRPQYLMKSLTFFNYILTTSDWSKTQLEREKRVVLNELYEKEEKLVTDYISAKAIWGGHPLSQPIIGSEKTIKSMNLDDLVKYKNEKFCKENVVLVITGMISNKNIERIHKVFENIQLNNNKISNINEIVQLQFKRKPKVSLVEFPWKPLDIQISFDVNLKLISENELIFLNSIIGGGDGSILPKEIREKSGLVYDIYSEIEIYKDAAILSIFLSIGKKDLYMGLEKIIKKIEELKVNIPQMELDTNMPFFTDNLWYWAENSYELNFQLGWNFIKEKKLLTIEENIKINEKIDCQRLRELADIIFRTENTSLIIMGEIRDISKKKLKGILHFG